MRLSLYIGLLVTAVLSAQPKAITLEDIWKDGTFRTERMDVLHSLKNGRQYSVLNFDRVTRSTSIEIFDYKTLEKVNTMVSSVNLEEIPYFTNYTFSEDEQKVILATNETPVYRHSALGKYYVYNVQKGTLDLISEEKIQEPTFSPDGKKVAFVKENNLYVKDLNSSVTMQITSDGEKNKIINGVTDWVYEEEFAFVRAFDWNADSDKIAFLRFDESLVPEFSMDVYGEALYQTQQVFKYPKAGEANSEVSLHMYDIQKKQSQEIKVNKAYQDFYIPRIAWTKNADVLSVQYMNRHQNELDLWMINAQANTSNLVLAERDKAYVDVTDNLTFLNDNSFIWTSEKDGFNHIYHFDKKGNLINQVTKGNWDVTNYYGYDQKKNTIFYQSVENGSINRDVYAVKLNGRNKQRLTKTDGTNSASFSADFSLFINTNILVQVHSK